MILGQPVSDVAPSLIDDRQFAITLASWLRALHAVPVQEEHHLLIKGNQQWRYDLHHRMSRCMENLTRYEAYFLQLGFEKTRLLETINLLPYLTFKENKKSYLHADLYSRHVVIGPKTMMPSGLIDCGDMHIGHPGIDLAVGMIFTEETFQVFLNHYGNIDDDAMHLLLFHSFCHHMIFLPYTCEQNKENLKKWAARVLNRAIHEIKNRC
ncbi:MAG: phosphotransferase family protein [Legionella sp.]